MLNNNPNNKQLISRPFNPKEERLRKILGKLDPQLSDIFMGIFKVLSDIKNPDRFHQAANSIRGITDILVRNIKEEVYSELNRNDNEKREEILGQLRKYFDEALQLMPVDSDKVEKNAQVDQVNQQYKKLEDALKRGSLTLKQGLKRYFGNDKDLSQMPGFSIEEIKTVISIWKKVHGDYFVNLSHYSGSHINEEEFNRKWQIIQNCLLKALSPFFDEIAVIDELLSLEEPPNE